MVMRNGNPFQLRAGLRARVGRCLLGVIVLAGSLMTSSSSVADGIADGPDRVVDALLEACGDDRRPKMAELVSTLRQEDSPADTILTEVLRETNPDFAAAVDALAEKDTNTAAAKLETLTSAENPYLAAESTFLLARAHILDDDHEKALPLLARVIEEHAAHGLRAGEALYLRGLSELHMLKRVEAIDSLTEFVGNYPNAPARMLVTARRNVQSLEQLELGSIDDVRAQMEYSRRRLTLEDSGKATQQVQGDVVAMLNSLIEEAQKPGGT